VLSFSLCSPPLAPTLVPYTTLFRSHHHAAGGGIDPEPAACRGRSFVIDADRGLDHIAHAVAELEIRKCRRRRSKERKHRRRKRRSEEHTSELQSPDHLVCRLLLEKK